MSVHAHLNPEALQKLRRQRRNSTISSILLALLISALIVSILFFIALTPLFKNEEELITYSSASDSRDEIIRPEITNQVEKKPSPPSSSVAKVIAANTPSPVAIPAPLDTTPEPSLDFGSANDFGDGWGGSGSGKGNSGGGASFFNQKVKAERIAYVIDYSLSMKSNGKIDLMKAELTKSIAALPDTVEYSLIFFAGPAWVAGDEVTMAKNRSSFEVRSHGKKYEWVNRGGAHRIKPAPDKKLQAAEWIPSSDSSREKSLKIIQNTPMVWGTVWSYPLEMALTMNPKPDVIFFMTDGSAGKESATVAEELGNKAKQDGIIVNTIALMQPKAIGPMGELAKITGGLFTLVESDGSVKEIEVE